MKFHNSSDIVGCVELAHYSEKLLTIRGWSIGRDIVVETDGRRHRVSRRTHRADISTIHQALLQKSGNKDGLLGFEINIPFANGPASISIGDVPDAGPWTIPQVPARHAIVKQIRANLAFIRDLACAVPTAARYFFGGRQRQDRDKLRNMMGFHDPIPSGLLLEPDFLLPPYPLAETNHPVTIILPVYNAFDLLVQALDRVEKHTDVPWHLFVIEDASPDERIRPWLQEWAATRKDNVTLIENQQNLGFIGSVNKGLIAAKRRKNPVVLLNSDALVPKGWASRLVQPLFDDPRIASVTPMSNDATIMTVPWIGRQSQLVPDTADRIDAAAARLSPRARAYVPTGVGFCMAISPRALEIVPSLDPAFGQGYGEEVDWCCKTAQSGMLHVAIGNLFVEHKGGQSFGNTAKTEALHRSGQIISARHPGFDADVQDFISADPLITARLYLGLAQAATLSDQKTHIYLAHSMGGGANYWLENRIARRMDQGLPSIVLRVGGQRRFRVELHMSGDVQSAETDETRIVRRMLDVLPNRHIVYSCGVGDHRAWELPLFLCDLASSADDTLEVLFHDYFPISPSVTLLGADGRFSGLPTIDTQDPAHVFHGPDGDITLKTWHENWAQLARLATTITVFSESSAHLVRKAWPDAADKIHCRPHSALFPMPRLAPPQGPETIGILGAIGETKGAKIVSDLAFYLDKHDDAPKLKIIGEFDHSFPLPPSATVTGRYEAFDLPRILETSEIKVWLMPSIWPETFSYTTHEMLATGLPVIAFDLGAQGDAIKAHPNGHIARQTPEDILACYDKIRSDMPKTP